MKISKKLIDLIALKDVVKVIFNLISKNYLNDARIAFNLMI